MEFKDFYKVGNPGSGTLGARVCVFVFVILSSSTFLFSLGVVLLSLQSTQHPPNPGQGRRGSLDAHGPQGTDPFRSFGHLLRFRRKPNLLHSDHPGSMDFLFGLLLRVRGLEHLRRIIISVARFDRRIRRVHGKAAIQKVGH